MADKRLFPRLKRLFSTDVVIRNVGGNQLKVFDVNSIQKTGNLDTNALDTEGEGLYINIEDVPDWIQRKLAVLMMVKTYGADITTPEIEGVGRRISNGGDEADCFWVYKDC